MGLALEDEWELFTMLTTGGNKKNNAKKKCLAAFEGELRQHVTIYR